jgi:hypothetical protein
LGHLASQATARKSKIRCDPDLEKDEVEMRFSESFPSESRPPSRERTDAGLANRHSRTHGGRGSDPARTRALLAADMPSSRLAPALMEQHLDSEVRAIKLRDANASRRRFRSSIFESARRIGRGIERVGVRSGHLSQGPHSKDVLPYLSREVELLTSLQILRGFNITAGGSEKD